MLQWPILDNSPHIYTLKIEKLPSVCQAVRASRDVTPFFSAACLWRTMNHELSLAAAAAATAPAFDLV